MSGFWLTHESCCWLQLTNLKALVDERHLQSALPLLQKGRVKVPMMLHVAQVTAVKHSNSCLPKQQMYMQVECGRVFCLTSSQLALRCRWQHTQGWSMPVCMYT